MSLLHEVPNYGTPLSSEIPFCISISLNIQFQKKYLDFSYSNKIFRKSFSLLSWKHLFTTLTWQHGNMVAWHFGWSINGCLINQISSCNSTTLPCDRFKQMLLTSEYSIRKNVIPLCKLSQNQFSFKNGQDYLPGFKNHIFLCVLWSSMLVSHLPFW